MTLKIAWLCILLRIVFANNLTSSKRGLIYIQSAEDESDDAIWNSPNSDLTWYYNYGAYPTQGLSQKYEFVPMLWGKPEGDSETFNNIVKGLIDGGTNVEYVLTFNEPDLCNDDGYGGSCIDPQEAAQLWLSQVQPLKKMNVKLGAPSVTSAPTGNDWLAEFYAHCDGKCTPDFVPLHYYGPFDYLEDYVSGMHATYENISTIWITEFGIPDVSLLETQSFYNNSVAFLDESSYVTHYAYFGSFRSSAANSYVGPNVAMLNRGGSLTDIGAWYLGRRATGNSPSSSNEPNGAITKKAFTGWMALILATAMWIVA